LSCPAFLPNTTRPTRHSSTLLTQSRRNRIRRAIHQRAPLTQLHERAASTLSAAAKILRPIAKRLRPPMTPACSCTASCGPRTSY
jgi:hypothetical protein